MRAPASSRATASLARSGRPSQTPIAAIEDRDGVRFYVEPSSAFEPVKLLRTPGLYREHTAGGKPPPPPPAEAG